MITFLLTCVLSQMNYGELIYRYNHLEVSRSFPLQPSYNRYYGAGYRYYSGGRINVVPSYRRKYHRYLR